MGLLTSNGARREGRATPIQVVSGLGAFVALSVIGGLLLSAMVLPAVSVAGSATMDTVELFEELPDELTDVDLQQASFIYARDGETLLATFYNQNRIEVPIEDISPWLQMAVVAIEDRRFFEHNGVDGEGLVRVAVATAQGDDAGGASTLTQQVVKNTLLQAAEAADDDEAKAAATEVSVARKVQEWRYALALEQDRNKTYGTDCTGPQDEGIRCGKDWIVQEYLNIAQFGMSVYGVEAASQYYFSKPASDITAIEAATIAGITQNPWKWDPTRTFAEGETNYETSQIRRDAVLEAMNSEGYITDAEYREYLATPLEETLNVSAPKVSCAASDIAPFFCDYVTKVIAEDEVFNSDGLSGRELLYRGGLSIVTTLDVDMQKAATEALYDNVPVDDPNGLATAMAALEPATGQILAMSQNRDYDATSDPAPGTTAINYATDIDYGGSQGFSTGSAFKPLVLAAWLQEGHPLMQVIDSSKEEYPGDAWTASCLENPAYGDWELSNAAGVNVGGVTVLDGTAYSYNTTYAGMALQMDLCDVKTVAEKMGFHTSDGTDFQIVPSAVLGTNNSSPLTMASTYQTIANHGVHCDPTAILSVSRTNADGEIEEFAVPESNCRQVIDPDVADGVSWAMQKGLEYGTGRSVHLANGQIGASKSGTAELSRHTWFGGFTNDLVSVFWLGNPNEDVEQRNISVNGVYYTNVWGSSVMGPTWKQFMDKALVGYPPSALATPTDEILNGVPVRVPDFVGMTEEEARAAARAAGFIMASTPSQAYSSAYAPGTVVAQSPGSNSTATYGTVIQFTVATDSLPHWFDHWPSQWDRSVPPDDYWGSTWPPVEFESNPPDNWIVQCIDGDEWNEDTGEWCPGYPVDDGNNGGGNDGGPNGGGNNWNG